MHHRFISTALVLGALLSASCQGNRVETTQPTPAHRSSAQANVVATAPDSANPVAVAPAQTATNEASLVTEVPAAAEPVQAIANAIPTAEQPGPTFGILTRVDAGDNRCYVSMTGQDGQDYNYLSATFVVCTDEYLHRAVKLTYERLGSLNCEDSGEDFTEIAITAIAPVDTDQIVSTRYSNQDWDIIVSSFEPWSGINNTGNATYKGCDSEGNCIELSGGTSTCRDGECWTTWHNGNTRYSIIETLSEKPTNTARLLVLIDGQVGVDDATLQIHNAPNPQ